MTQKSSPIQKKVPIPTPQEEDVQQALAVLWQLKEQGRVLKSVLEAAVKELVREGVLESLSAQGLVVFKGEDALFSREGEEIARNVIRRHRLAERLLKDVLELPAEKLDPNACRMEHVITPDVEEAICTLLGHPQACPHGSPVPRGTCCERADLRTGPIVTALSSLSSGQEGLIAYLSPHNRPELHKLLSLGLVPGISVRVAQTYPAFVVSLNETLLAMDSSLARNIFIRKKNGGLK